MVRRSTDALAFHQNRLRTVRHTHTTEPTTPRYNQRRIVPTTARRSCYRARLPRITRTTAINAAAAFSSIVLSRAAAELW